MSGWGYAPYRPDLTAPADRRRFVFWARSRGVDFDVIGRGAGVHDLVVLSARADLSRWRQEPRRTKVVYDVVDSYLAVRRLQLRSLLRGPAKFAARETSALIVDYRRAMEQMCRRADAVVCATEEQRQLIGPLNDNVHVILDSHGELDRAPKSSFVRGDALHLVWEGLPENLAGFHDLRPALRRLSAEQPVHLHLVTALEYAKYVGRFVHRRTADDAAAIHDRSWLYQWHVDTLPAIAAVCDIAVIPLDLGDDLARGKPENKLLSFWRMGLPTVTSATPAYRRAMAGAGLELVCRDADEWYDLLRGLADDEVARRTAAEKGRAYVLRHHDDELLLAKWDNVFHSIGP